MTSRWPSRASLRAGVLAHADEVLDRAVDEEIVPALEIERRHGDVRPSPSDAPRLPVRVVVGVFQPVEVVRGDARILRVERRIVLQRQEQLPLVGVCLLRGRELRVEGRAFRKMPHGAVRDAVHRPVLREGLVERAAFVRPAVPVVGRRHRRDDRSEMRWSKRRRKPLRRAGIRESVHPDLAVRLRQRRGPFDRVVPVSRFASKRIPHAV